MLFPYLTCAFSKSTLSNLVKECFGDDFPDIIQKKQINYIYNYLKDLEAKSVLLEADYVDKDYLEDYSRYYVKCFNRYGERCARLHFFSAEIDHSKFDEVFEGNSKAIKNEISESYLGFIVVKPIPKTFIGKTCLKVYDGINRENTKNLITKNYKVNLFGIELSVESIAFQEQDKVLSACATTAIWCVLNAVKGRSVRDIPSSSEITLAAINHINNSANTFPNNGLTNKQILRALDTENLRHNLVNVRRFYSDEGAEGRLFGIIKTHIDSGVPMILGVDVYEKEKGKLNRLDGHAVSVLGYKSDVNDRALYLHDDRLGPFARARLGKVKEFFPAVECDEDSPTWCIALQEKDDQGNWLPVTQILKPVSLIIPTEKKVRIPAEYIEKTCRAIVEEYDGYIQELKGEGKDVSEFENCLSYEVKLEELSEIRQRVMASPDVKNKRSILTKSSARNSWCAKFTYKSECAFEILFDATDIPQGRVVSNVIIYDEEKYKASIVRFRSLIASKERLPEAGESSFLGSFIHFLQEKDSGFHDYLNEKYGELRAPKYLKEGEVGGGRLHSQNDVKKLFGRVDGGLCDLFPGVNLGDKLIWAIAHDGALLMGKELDGKGHPTLTGFKPARIAGELKYQGGGKWKLNSKSGRYSGDYEANANALLRNARVRFFEVFSKEGESSIEIEDGY